MKTKRQLRRKLEKAERELNQLKIELDNVKRARYIAIKENEATKTAAKAAREAEENARAMADKLLHINDVLCAELQDCDRCIDTVRMALEQKTARAELMNRITGPLV